MRLITDILFPVDFSPSCIAMAPYVKRAAGFYGAKVSLIHVFDPASYNGFELYVRQSEEIAEEHREIARNRHNAFLKDEFPISQYPRILVAGKVSPGSLGVGDGPEHFTPPSVEFVLPFGLRL